MPLKIIREPVSLTEQLRRKLEAEANPAPDEAEPGLLLPPSEGREEAVLAYLVEEFSRPEKESRSLQAMVAPRHGAWKAYILELKGDGSAIKRFNPISLSEALLRSYSHAAVDWEKYVEPSVSLSAHACSRYRDISEKIPNTDKELFPLLRSVGLQVLHLESLCKQRESLRKNWENALTLAQMFLRTRPASHEITQPIEAALSSLWNYVWVLANIQSTTAHVQKALLGFYSDLGAVMARRRAEAQQQEAKAARRQAAASSSEDDEYPASTTAPHAAPCVADTRENYAYETSAGGQDLAYDPLDDHFSGTPDYNVNGQPMFGGVDTFGNSYGTTFNDPW